MSMDSSSTPSSILVIGSSGFIGSHLTTLLASQGHRVVGFDHLKPGDDFGVNRFIQGDVRDAEQLRRAMEGIDTVINLAAVHFDFGHTDDEYFETNEGGMKALLQAMTQANVRRLIFTSSIAVYGDRDDEPNEQTAPSPTSPYGASKLAAEHVVEQWAEQASDRQVVIMRPCAVYGERNISNMMNLIRQINSGFFLLFGSGKNPKATAYVGNLVDAIALQVSLLRPGIQVYNYADKPDLSVREIVTIIRQALGQSPRPLTLPLWLGILAAIPFELAAKLTGRNFPVSIARVKKLSQPTQVSAQRIRDAGFQQRVDSREGLQRMVRHFQEHRTEPKP
jgi:nucleoside-diphosphate-sugar epimerase